jgi:cobalt-zinc-cadmium efflux system membrane fusion protein
VDENRSGEVHCHFEKYDKRLLPGMFMNAEVELQNANVTAVPDDAVVKWENKPYIFGRRVIKDNLPGISSGIPGY